MYRRVDQWLLLSAIVAALLAACAPSAPPPTAPPASPAAQPTAVPAKLAAEKPADKPAVAKPAAKATEAPAAKKALEKVSYLNDFRLSGSSGPIFLAREKGYFAEQGLEVEIIEGSGSANTAKVVGAGTSPLGRVDGGVVVQSVAQGLPIKVVAGLIQKSPIGVVVPRASGLSKPKDLEGKKLGGAQGGAGEVLLPAWLRLNGVNPDKVELIQVTAATRAATLLQGQVDGIVGFSYSEPAILKDRGGMDAVAILYADYGFNVPGLSFVANSTFIKEKPDIVRRFVAAVLKGFADAQKDPKVAVDALLKQGQASTLNPAVETAVLTDMLKLLHTNRTQGKPLGWMAAEDWDEAIKILAEHSDLPRKPRVDEVITNDFVPQN